VNISLFFLAVSIQSCRVELANGSATHASTGVSFSSTFGIGAQRMKDVTGSFGHGIAEDASGRDAPYRVCGVEWWRIERPETVFRPWWSQRNHHHLQPLVRFRNLHRLHSKLLKYNLSVDGWLLVPSYYDHWGSLSPSGHMVVSEFATAWQEGWVLTITLLSSTIISLVWMYTSSETYLTHWC